MGESEEAATLISQARLSGSLECKRLRGSEDNEGAGEKEDDEGGGRAEAAAMHDQPTSSRCHSPCLQMKRPLSP